MTDRVAAAGAPSWPARAAAATTVFGYRGVVAAVLVGGLLWTVSGGATRFGDAWQQGAQMRGTLLAVVLAILAVFAATVWLARRRAPLSPLPFVLATTALGIALRVVYLLAVDPDWTSDFAHYWESAQRLVNEGYQVRDIYEERAMPVLVPLIELFGVATLPVKVLNVIGLAATQLFAYDLLRRLHSHQAAQAFTVLWLAVPETTFSVAIPSHDLVAVAMLSAVFWLNVVAAGTSGARRARAWRFIAATVLTSALLVHLEVARSIGLFVVLVFLVAGTGGLLLAWGGQARMGDLRRIAVVTLAQGVIGLVVLQASLGWMTDRGYVQQETTRELKAMRAITPAANSMSDGSFGWFQAFNDNISTPLLKDPARLRGLRDGLGVSDFLERPVDAVRQVARRGERLFAIGTQLSYYHAGWDKRHPYAASTFRWYNTVFAPLFGLALIVAMLRLLTVPAPAQLYLPVLLITGLALSCVAILFNQPRYIYPIWWVGALVIAFEAARWRRPDAWPGAPRALAGLAWQTAAFVTVAPALLWLALSASFTEARGRVLAGWKLATTQDAPDADAHFASLAGTSTDAITSRAGVPLHADFGPLATTLELPLAPRAGDAVEATREVCLPTGATALAFHVYTPYKRLERRGAFTLTLLQDGETVWSLELPAADRPVAVQVPLRAASANGCSELAFRLTANVTYDAESWRRASRTEIFLPRLEPAPAP